MAESTRTLEQTQKKTGARDLNPGLAPDDHRVIESANTRLRHLRTPQKETISPAKQLKLAMVIAAFAISLAGIFIAGDAMLAELSKASVLMSAIGFIAVLSHK